MSYRRWNDVVCLLGTQTIVLKLTLMTFRVFSLQWKSIILIFDLFHVLLKCVNHYPEQEFSNMQKQWHQEILYKEDAFLSRLYVCNSIKKRFRGKCFSVNFVIFRTAYFEPLWAICSYCSKCSYSIIIIYIMIRNKAQKTIFWKS